MRILAIDPAAKCGFAHSDGHVGVWRLTAATDKHPGARLVRLRSLLYAARRNWGFELLAFEDAQMGSNNAIVQGMHAELRAVLKLVAKELGDIRVVSVAPTTLKVFATGSGRAKKPDMIRTARRQLGYGGVDDNEADALWVLEWARLNPNGTEGPKARKRRIQKVRAKAPRLF